jgi:hypothetical protein
MKYYCASIVRLLAHPKLFFKCFWRICQLISRKRDVNLLKDDFRKDAMQIVSNYRGALTLAIADVSNELELRSRLYNYASYTTLEEYADAETYGEKLLATWHKVILQQYAGRMIPLRMQREKLVHAASGHLNL